MEAAKTRLAELDASIERGTELRGRLMGLQTARDAVQEAQRGATAAQVEVDGWDLAAKALDPGGPLAQGGANQELLEACKDTVVAAAEALLGRPLQVNPDWTVELDGRSEGALSSSARWRVSVAIQAALGASVGLPVLLIDEADILDADNRDHLVELLVRASARFNAVVACMTGTRELAEPLTDGVARWWLESGTLTQL
jgi:hypothetical protein